MYGDGHLGHRKCPISPPGRQFTSRSQEAVRRALAAQLDGPSDPSEHDWPRWSDEALALAPPTGVFWTEIPATGDVTFVGAMAQTLHLVAGEGKAHLNFCVASRGVQGAMTGLGHLLQDAKAAPSPADGQPQSVRLTFAQMTCPGVSSARAGRARSGNPNAVTVSPLVLEERVRPKTNMHPGIRVVLISHESVLLLM